MRDYRSGMWMADEWSKLAAAAGKPMSESVWICITRETYTDKTAFRVGTAKRGLGIDPWLEIFHVLHFFESGDWTSRAISGPCRQWMAQIS